MSDRPWTPEPWVILDSNEVHDLSGRWIATVRWLHGMPAEQFAANKRLIAAAPELAEALHEAVLQIEYLHVKFRETGSGNGVLSRIRALLARIEGREP